MDKKIRIAIAGSRGYPYVYSGYETFVKELAERLVTKEFDVTVYNHRNLFTSFPKSVSGIHLVYIPTIEKKTLSQFIHSFQSILHACWKKFDIILVMNSANGPFGLFTKIFHRKAAINVDGLEWLRPKWRGLGARYFYWASKMATKLYDVIITDSLEMQKIYENLFHCPSVYIAYGAEIRKSQKPSLIKRWNLEERGYYLIVGRLIPDNNAHLIVKEFLQTDSTRKLVIVGDVPYKDSFAADLKAKKDVRLVFTGYIKDQDVLEELYHHCYAYLHGHEFGGTNPALLRALGNRCAIVALDTPFSREVLNDGEYGLFFTKKVGSLRDLLLEIEAAPALVEEFRNKSQRRILECYTWGKIIDQYIDLFKKMAGKER